MLQTTKHKIFYVGLGLLIIACIIIRIVKPGWVNYAVGAVLLWFAALPKKKEVQSAEEIKRMPIDTIREHLSDETNSNLNRIPDEIEQTIGTGIQNARRNKRERD